MCCQLPFTQNVIEKFNSLAYFLLLECMLSSEKKQNYEEQQIKKTEKKKKLSNSCQVKMNFGDTSKVREKKKFKSVYSKLKHLTISKFKIKHFITF